MLVAVGLVLGALGGALAARRRGGTATDMAHWAAVWGIGLAILGLVATILIEATL